MTRTVIRFPGHALTVNTDNRGRPRGRRMWTGSCKCGWDEPASTRDEVRREYGFHLQRVARERAGG